MDENLSRLPIDRGWAWMIVLGYFISVFFMVGIAKSFGILLGEFVAYFDVPVALGALVMGVAGGVYTIAAPICIALSQHFGQRAVVLVGGVVGGVGIALGSFLFSIEYVIFMCGAMYGIGNSCIFGCGLVIIGNYFRKWRGLANGLGLSGASIGQFVLAPLLTYLIEAYTLRGALLILGGLYLNVAVCAMLYRPPSFYTGVRRKAVGKEERVELLDKSKPADITDSGGKGDSSVEKSADTLGDSVGLLEKAPHNGDVLETASEEPVDCTKEAREQAAATEGKEDRKAQCKEFFKKLIDFSVLKNYVVIFYTTVSFLLFVGYFNFIIFMPQSAYSKGVSKFDKAWLVSVTGICDLFGRILIGILGDLQFVARYKLMSVACLICGAAIFFFVFAQSYWLMALLCGFYGFFGGCYVAINAPVLIDLVGLKTMPRALGVVLFIQGLGAAFGQPILGALRDSLGSYDVVNYINSAAMIAGALLLMAYSQVKKLQDARSEEVADVEVKAAIAEVTENEVKVIDAAEVS